MKNIHKGFIAVLVIIVMALLGVGGAVYYFSQNKTSSTPSGVEVSPLSYVDDCGAKSGVSKETCLLQKAAISGNVEFCSNHVRTASANYDKWECYAEIAAAQRAPSICSKVPTADIDKCKDVYATIRLDATQCSPQQSKCVTKINEWLTKYSLENSDCKQMTQKVANSAFNGGNNVTRQYQCFEFLANLELEPKYCEDSASAGVGERTIQQCKDRVQKAEFSAKECATQMGFGYQQDQCYYQLAQQEKNSNFCNYIGIDVLKNRCVATKF
jgi:hypothetical protein